MNTCLLSMLLLTIGSAFLAALATYFKRQAEVDALNVRIKKMKTTLEKLDVEHRNSIAYYEGMREEITNYATERDTVEKEIQALEAQVETLTAENETLRNPAIAQQEVNEEAPKLLPTPDGDNGDGVEFAQSSTRKKKQKLKKKKSKSKSKDVEILSEQNEALEKEVEELKAYKTKVEELEAKMESITKKIEVKTPVPSAPESPKKVNGITSKKIERSNPKENKSGASNNNITKTATPSSPQKINKSILKRINRRRKEVDFETIGFSAVGRKDDLQKIKGIEPFIEKKLNALGIYRFSQIANFNEEIAKKVSNLIEMESTDTDLLEWSEHAKSLTD